MGNSSGKESRSAEEASSRSGNASSSTPPLPHGFALAGQRSTSDRPTPGGGLHGHRLGRGARHDLGFLTLGGGSASERDADPNQRKETKQEREARKLEKERILRARERERSLREESVDGGYLVTLGTYVGPEDFSKPTVRHLQIERRLAPFWRGLNDHSDSWTEHQLVAAARGKPIPAPDEIPAEESEPPTPTAASVPTPISPLSPMSPPAGSTLQPFVTQSSVETSSSPNGTHLSPAGAYALRTKSSADPGRPGAPAESTPQETQLPQNPQINGQPVEAYLYKDVGECPICFLYYPPYLNRTRCCDQPICSECFVQIKRPDPHPPEHQDPNTPAPTAEQQAAMAEEGQLVSEEATCPFCVQSNLGITYDPPPFRRGLAYANQASHERTSTSGSLSPRAASSRARGVSISASDPRVVTTDMVRPDWFKKLSDARAHAARRSAAATALHTAAYMMQGSQNPAFALGRRRRAMFADQGGEGARPEALNRSQMEQLIAVLEGQGSSRGTDRRVNRDLFPNRSTSRGTRGEDLEEMMMMEAIRLSLVSEEERKKKEEKEAAKKAKKDEKSRAKEQKKADKAARKIGSLPPSQNNSGFFSTGSEQQEARAASPSDGKGKARLRGDSAPSLGPASRMGFNPLEEPTSTLNTEDTTVHSSAQRHLTESRAHLRSESMSPPTSDPLPAEPKGSLLSVGSSDPSTGNASFEESVTAALRRHNQSETSLSRISNDHQSPLDSHPDSRSNFRSTAALVSKDRGSMSTVGSAGADGSEQRSMSRSRSRSISRSRGASAASERPASAARHEGNGSIQSTAARVAPVLPLIPGRFTAPNVDQKHGGNVSVTDSQPRHQA